MEQWQFLIQKQGERAWLPLESGYAEIVEGRYRIVASSESANTDVEVKVTHQSPSEIPPRRRIHKRLRRTNLEGLTAIIPFTYFAPGVWEVRCSGDLMSDIFGTSWQHNLRLQVLPLIATTEITPAKNDTEGLVASVLPVPPPPFPYLSYETASLETPVENIISETISENTGLNLSSLDSAAAELETIASSTQFVNDTAKENIEVSTNNIDIVTEALSNTESENLSLDAQDTPDNQNEQNIVVTDTTDTTETIDVIIDEPVSLSINSLVLLHNNEEIITDQPVNPVWVKGDTAEQILQNLIELALPDNDSLLEEEVTTSGQLEQPLPLLLILEEQSYVAQWGGTLTVRGRVKLRAEGELYKDDTCDFESVGLGELRVELRSPLGLEELVQQQQSVGEKLLPFGFEFSIEIPANCESKLILADIYFYGALSSVGDAILLANQSFTITADVAQLLAVSATANEREPDMLDLAQPQLSPEPEKSVSIDLELFNLVKTAKKPLAPLVTQPSPKRVLPPLVDASTSKAQTPSLSDSGNYASQLVSIVENSTSLPFLRKRQIPIEKETASNILIEHTELPEKEPKKEPEIELPLLEQENLVEQENLEDNSKSQTYINDAVEEKDIAFDITVENTEHNQDDYIVTNNQHQNFAQPKEEPQQRAIYNDAGTNNVPYVSPLIQKWMQSQGYSIPQTTNLGYQYNAAMAPSDLPNYISTYNSTQNEITNNESSNIQHEETDLLESVTSSTHDIDIASVEVPVNVNTSEEKTPSDWIAQEIVVDDIDDNDNSTNSRDLELDKAPQQSVAEMLSSLPSLEDIELLPVPQINLPPKELVSGNTIRVRILLKEMRPNTGVKLWVEDCQTRWLLEGPHLLTDLQPNPFESGMEVITELNIPFGCVEIRIEAIAIDIITQLESDKASIQRTVVPPDLPVLQFDELLGI